MLFQDKLITNPVLDFQLNENNMKFKVLKGTASFHWLAVPFVLMLSINCNEKSHVSKANIEIPVLKNVEIDQFTRINNTDQKYYTGTNSIMRIYPMYHEGDTTFLIKTRDSKSYIIKDLSNFTLSDANRYPHIDDSSDILMNQCKIYQYNVEKNELKDLKGNYLAALNGLRSNKSYFSTIPYTRRLIFHKENPEFVYQYALFNGENCNFYDTSLFLTMHDTATITKTGKYNRAIFNALTLDKETYFTVDSINNIYYVHASLDTLFKIAPDGQALAKAALNPVVKRSKVDKNKLTDLAWRRNYAATNMKNAKIEIIHNGDIVLLRKLPANSILDKKEYQVMVFDQQLNLLYSNKTPGDIFPVIIPGFNGFHLLSADRKYIYDYKM